MDFFSTGPIVHADVRYNDLIGSLSSPIKFSLRKKWMTVQCMILLNFAIDRSLAYISFHAKKWSFITVSGLVKQALSTDRLAAGHRETNVRRDFFSVQVYCGTREYKGGIVRDGNDEGNPGYFDDKIDRPQKSRGCGLQVQVPEINSFTTYLECFTISIS